MQTERELSKAGKSGQGFQLVVGIECAAGVRVPLRARKTKLAQTVQAAQPVQFLGRDQGTDEVNSLQVEVASRETAQVGDRLALPLDNDAAALPDHPLGDGPVGNGPSSCRQSGKA